MKPKEVIVGDTILITGKDKNKLPYKLIFTVSGVEQDNTRTVFSGIGMYTIRSGRINVETISWYSILYKNEKTVNIEKVSSDRVETELLSVIRELWKNANI
jgi:hypothetical protein